MGRHFSHVHSPFLALQTFVQDHVLWHFLAENLRNALGSLLGAVVGNFQMCVRKLGVVFRLALTGAGFYGLDLEFFDDVVLENVGDRSHFVV